LNAQAATLHVRDSSTSFKYTVSLNGQRLANLLVLTLYATDLIPEIPLAIDNALHGDVGLLTAFCNDAEFQDDAISRGMWYSVECAEDAPFVTPADIAAAELALIPPLRSGDIFNLAGRWSMCQFWHVQPLPPAHKQAVTSTIPTLILQGEYDPVNPPANGELVAHTLSHSYEVVFPGVGHGSLFGGGCPLQIGLAFQNDPQQAPNTSCVMQMGELFFIS
jgi:pimeloyl-ACP methyl ester carboxylesterase